MINCYWHAVGLLAGMALLPAAPVQAQSGGADSLHLAATTTELRTRYLTTQGPEAGLYNGQLYVSYLPPNVVGQPYLGDGKPLSGTVQYSGYLYHDQSLLYDVRRDVLVLMSDNVANRLQLVGEKVGFFTLDTRRFVYLNAKTGVPETGYYEDLFTVPASTKLQLLARHTKTLERRGGVEFKQEIREKTRYYLRTTEGVATVSSAGSVLKQLPEQYRKELKKYLHEQHLRFAEPQRAASMKALVAEYYRLTQASAH